MADLLTHVLLTYAALTVASWRVEWITPPWVAVAMGGAAMPDLLKVQILVDADAVGDLLGAPFSYAPIATLGGIAVVAVAITVCFERRYWRRAYGFLLVGGLSSLVVDGLRAFATGTANPWLFPLTWRRPPTPSLYVTSDPRIVVVAIAVAGAVAGWQWHARDRHSTDDRHSMDE